MVIAASILDFSIFGIRILDVVDVLIVAYLFYVIYKLLRGTIAFNIFVGVVLFYTISIAVDYLDMRLLSIVLGPFVVSGVLILIIIFQPEVRQFLFIRNIIHSSPVLIRAVMDVRWDIKTPSVQAMRIDSFARREW